METISLEQLMSGDCCRSMDLPVPGLGLVKVYELSGAESDQFHTDLAALGKGNDENRVFVARWAFRLMSQDKKMPTDKQIKTLQESCNPNLLVKIYGGGLAFNLVDDAAQEGIEKN